MRDRMRIGSLAVALTAWTSMTWAQAPAAPNTTEPFNLYYGYYRSRPSPADSAGPVQPSPAISAYQQAYILNNARRMPTDLLMYGTLGSAIAARTSNRAATNKAPSDARSERLTDDPADHHPTTSAPYRTTRDPGSSSRFQNLGGYFPLANGR